MAATTSYGTGNFSIVVHKSLFALLMACIFLFGCARSADAAHLQSQLNILPLTSADGQTSLKIWLRTPEGTDIFILKPSAGFSLSDEAEGVGSHLLFAGRSLRAPLARKTPVSPVSATIIDGTLKFVFAGRRRAKLYQLEAQTPVDWPGLNSSPLSLKARVSSVSEHFSVNCASDSPHNLRLPAASAQAEDVSALPFSPPLYLDISADATYSWKRRFGSQSFAQIVSILNTAQAIYLEQLGIRLRLIARHTWPKDEQAFQTSDSIDLLQGFRRLSENSLQLPPADIYHLFTADPLNDRVIGISYVGATCNQNSYAYSLTTRVNTAIQALVTAHEIGHNLGATHPEESLPDEPASLMTTVIHSENRQFSAFSLSQISGHLNLHNADNSCLGESPAPLVRIIPGLEKVRRRLSIAARPGNLPPELTCQAKLYVAGSARRLRDVLLEARRPFMHRSFPSEKRQVRLSRRIPRHPAARGLMLYYRLKIVCPGEVSSLSVVRRSWISEIGSPSNIR